MFADLPWTHFPSTIKIILVHTELISKHSGYIFKKFLKYFLNLHWTDAG